MNAAGLSAALLCWHNCLAAPSLYDLAVSPLVGKLYFNELVKVKLTRLLRGCAQVRCWRQQVPLKDCNSPL